MVPSVQLLCCNSMTPEQNAGTLREDNILPARAQVAELSRGKICRMDGLSRFLRSVGAYIRELQNTPSLFRRRVFLTKTFDQMVQSAQISSHNPMKRVLPPLNFLKPLLCA